MQETAQTPSLVVGLSDDALGGLFSTKTKKSLARTSSNKTSSCSTRPLQQTYNNNKKCKLSRLRLVGLGDDALGGLYTTKNQKKVSQDRRQTSRPRELRLHSSQIKKQTQQTAQTPSLVVRLGNNILGGLFSAKTKKSLTRSSSNQTSIQNLASTPAK